jgi:hypothetical protein
MVSVSESLPGHELVSRGLADLSAGRARPSMRLPVDEQRIRVLAHELGRVARG